MFPGTFAEHFPGGWGYRGMKLVALAFISVLALGCDTNTNYNKPDPDRYKSVNVTNNGWVDDLYTQYTIAKKHGDPFDACIQAGALADAYLQLHDENHYEYWRNIQRGDCRRAGF